MLRILLFAFSIRIKKKREKIADKWNKARRVRDSDSSRKPSGDDYKNFNLLRALHSPLLLTLSLSSIYLSLLTSSPYMRIGIVWKKRAKRERDEMNMPICSCCLDYMWWLFISRSRFILKSSKAAHSAQMNNCYVFYLYTIASFSFESHIHTHKISQSYIFIGKARRNSLNWLLGIDYGGMVLDYG